MSDVLGLRHKPTLGIASLESIGGQLRASQSISAPANTAYPSNNLGYYVPLALRYPFLLKKFWAAVGIAGTSTTDMGIYSAGGTLLTSIGPQTTVGSNVLQSFTLGTAMWLSPGNYYIALSCSSTGTSYRAIVVAAQNTVPLGLAQQATVSTLPATATFASFAQTSIPIFGISSAAVI